MDIGFSGPSLAVFTGLTPAGAIAFALLALYLLLARGLDARRRTVIGYLMVLPLGVAWAGLIAAATHLGTPANALYSFSALGTSPLTNEVVSVVLFLFFSGMSWLYGFARKPERALEAALFVVTIVAAVNLLVHTSTAYAVSTVPSWDNAFVPATIVLGAGCAGCALAAFVLLASEGLAEGAPAGEGLAGEGRSTLRVELVLLVGSLVLLVANALVVGQYVEFLAGLSNNVVAVGELARVYDGDVLVFAALAVAGLALQVVASSRRIPDGKVRLLVGFAGCLLVCAAAIFIRLPFYEAFLSIGF